MEVFFTPLAFEVLDRFIADFSRNASSLHPAMLAQICYRECVSKEHRQPLTESLFTSSETGPALGVSVDLPRVHISLFECSLIGDSASGEVKTAANIGLILLQKASVSSGTIKEFAERGTSFHAHFSVLSAQLLHFTPRLVSDFAGNRVSFNASVNWEKSSLASRLLDIEPRVVVDFQIPDLEVLVERRESQQKSL
ncbi:unnamed protein product [Strongylus vulgaris]|uniref:Uncharacterized protein n=1 Tax=Strongylus vulgaris TaxID=40348 RepID=A0A3P7IKQ8_STRVU|nr:unnamed protein product [Strongylus vulgaris]